MKLYHLIFLIPFLHSCQENEALLFTEIEAERSNIHFSNNLLENEKYNVHDYHNLYNGGGVAVFDINNDGLLDLYFTGNQVNDKLYLNKGNFVFEDITDQAGIIQKGWSTGVTVLDINTDGYLDLYVCKAGNESEEDLKNLLFVNQGNLTFTEEAENWGIADSSLSTQAAFFDYDKDGDLDLYVLTTSNLLRNPNLLHEKNQYGDYAFDKFYQNDGLGHFTEIGKQIGITENTHGLGLSIADINNDGWEDILASSDFLPNDALYLNNQDGTFTNAESELMPYQSRFSMGNDIADFNNDGLPEMVTVDMLPPDNEQQKKMLMTSYHVFETEQSLGYQAEFTRNMLFQNAGSDEKGKTYFNEIGQFSGIHATDWSWAPLIMDFDNDGKKDLYISNGYRRDVTDSDIISYNLSFAERTESESELKEFMNSNVLNSPQLARKNQFFRSEGFFKFSNKSATWLNQEVGFSNGAAFADLDNDGDLDYVVNNINQRASLFRNESSNNYVSITFSGNISQGAKVVCCTHGECQTYTNSVSRGYLSAMASPMVIGLGDHETIDSLEIVWPNGTSQTLTNLEANQNINLDSQNSFKPPDKPRDKSRLFTEVPFDYHYEENRFIDYYRENLLLRKYSQPGPVVVASDLNKNGLDDLFIGGNNALPARIFKQTGSEEFEEIILTKNQKHEDAGALFIDINNDGYADLYTLSGSNEFEFDSELYQDHIYLNDGSGNMVENVSLLPKINTPGAVVCAIDLDNDGRKDIFRAAAVLPGLFPQEGESYVLSLVGDKIERISLGMLGLVMDAQALDYNNDGWEDLIVVGEYMSPTLFLNKEGHLEKALTFDDLYGLWTSVSNTDLDGDGFEDLVIGNKGENFRYQFSTNQPLEYHSLDLNDNGQTEKFHTYYQNEKRHLVPARDELIRQYPYLRSLFPDYESYAITEVDKFISGKPLMKADYMNSIIIWNKGGVDFEIEKLPMEAQTFQVNTLLLEDFNNDGIKDILLAGNDFDSEPINAGYTEGSKSYLLINKGDRIFEHVSNSESGIWLNGSTKNLVYLENKKSSPNVLAALFNRKVVLYKVE